MDDIILFAGSSTELMEMAEELLNECKKASLGLNENQTKVTERGKIENLIIEGQKIEKVKEIKYLGQIIRVSFEDRSEK